MRNALDKQSSTLDFTLPNNRIIKIRKIDSSSLNITDEEKDKIYANHREGSPIFILKRRVKDDPYEPSNPEKNKSKIIIRRIVKNSFGNENEASLLTSNNDESSMVKKLTVGNVISVYEQTRDEQTNTVVKSFIFVPEQETSNDLNIQSRTIQIESDNRDQNQNSLNGIESEDNLTGGTYDVELSGPSDHENYTDDKGNELNSHSSDNENTSASATTSGNEDTENGNEELSPNATTSGNDENENEQKSNSSGSAIEPENIENKSNEEIIKEEEEEVEPQNHEVSIQNRNIIIEEEEEEVEPIENITNKPPEYYNMDDNMPQFLNLDDAPQFIQNDEQNQQFISKEEQDPQNTNYGDDQAYFNTEGQAPLLGSYEEQNQQFGNVDGQNQQYENFEGQPQQFELIPENFGDQVPQYEYLDQQGGQDQQYQNFDGQNQQFGNFEEQPQQSENFNEQAPQFGNYEQQIPQFTANEGENQQFFNEIDQAFQNAGDAQQYLNRDEQIPNVVDGEISQPTNDDEVAQFFDYGDGMQPVEGEEFQPFNFGEEEV